MERRKLIIGSYDTALRGPWTLAAWEFPEPEPQVNLVEIPGRDGPLDLSTALTDGEPVYSGSRELTATLECSEGTYADRVKLISEMVNMLNGRRLQIILPDDPMHYAEGRVTVKKEYNDMAHCAVTVTAICDPWRYKKTETVLTLTPESKPKTAVLPNAGRRVIVPTVELIGEGSWVDLAVPSRITHWGLHYVQGPAFILPDLKLQPGNTKLTYYGQGTMKITYREAVL